MTQKDGCQPGQVRYNGECIDEYETPYGILKGETLRNMDNVKELIQEDSLSEEQLDEILNDMRELQDNVNYMKMGGK